MLSKLPEEDGRGEGSPRAVTALAVLLVVLKAELAHFARLLPLFLDLCLVLQP